MHVVLLGNAAQQGCSRPGSGATPPPIYIYATGCAYITGSDYLTYKPQGAVLNIMDTLTYTRSIVIYPQTVLPTALPAHLPVTF